MNERNFVLHDPCSIDRVDDYLRSLARDSNRTIYEVLIRPWRSKRSADQNSLMWVWLTLIGDGLGYTKGEMRDIMVAMFLPYKVIEFNGKQIQHLANTRDLSVEEMDNFLVKIEVWCTENGIQLPNIPWPD